MNWMFSTFVPAVAGFTLIAGSAGAEVVVDLGTGEIASSTADLSEANANVTGSFVTTGAGPVTFDLAIEAVNGDIGSQNTALGVTGGIVAFGVDNNNTAGPLEALTFTISDFTGLGAGESLVITSVSLQFGSPSETYQINGGSDINFLVDNGTVFTPELIDVPDSVSFTVGAGTAGDTRFAVDSITVAVIPEPSSLALLSLAGLAVAGRRRRK